MKDEETGGFFKKNPGLKIAFYEENLRRAIVGLEKLKERETGCLFKKNYRFSGFGFRVLGFGFRV